MFPSMYLAIVGKKLSPSILMGFFLLLFTACSSPDGASIKGGDGGVVLAKPNAVTPSPELKFQVKADGDSPYIFGLTNAQKPDGEIQLVILDTSKEPPQFPIQPRDQQKAPLRHPKALLAVQDRGTVSLQHLFILFEGESDDESSHAVVEVLIQLDELKNGLNPVTMGRVFSVPVHGTLEGARLNLDPAGTRLILHIEALAGDASQPVILIYDISPTAHQLDPVDILMVPLN